ncbi:MAG: hypothetical protein AAGC56_14150, partial [Pseudomonadota bacterium]
PCPDTLAIVNACRNAGYATVATFNAAQTMDALETGGVDCGVFVPAERSDPLRSLAANLRRRAVSPPIPTLTIERDALSAGPRTLLAAHAAEDVAPRVSLAVRQARQHAWLRQFVHLEAGAVAADPYAPAAGSQFFARHAARVFAHADKTGRTVSLVALRLEADALADRPAAEIAAPLRKAGALINRVRRTHDLVGRIGPALFAMILTGAQRDDAARVAERVSGVLQNVMFEAPSATGGPPTLFAAGVSAAAVDRTHGAGVEETIAALLRALEEDAVSRVAR